MNKDESIIKAERNQNLNKNKIIFELSDSKFDFYTQEEIKKISIKQITSPNVFDNLNLPEIGSLHDPAMGVSAFDRNSVCEICNQNTENCTGHFGHLELPVPVYNPFMFNSIIKLLNAKCFNCHQLKISRKDQGYLFMKLFLIKLGLCEEANKIYDVMYESFGESTNILSENVINFLQKNLSLNKSALELSKNEMNIDLEDNNENKKTNNNKNKSKYSLFEKNENNEENKEYNQKENNKKGKKTKENENEEEEIHNKIINEKKQMLKEIFIKLEKTFKKLNKTKPLQLDQFSITIITALKDFETELWKMSKINNCAHCGAVSAKYKKVNNIKIFQINPSNKDKKKMIKSGIDTQKDALEDGISKRIKEKKVKKKEEKIQKLEDPINEFKNLEKNLIDNSPKKISKKKIEKMDLDEISENNNIENNENLKEEINQKFLHCLEVKEHLTKLFENDCGLITLFFGNLIYDKQSPISISIISNTPNMFFMQTLIIPPNRFRPENQVGSSEGPFLHQQTSLYQKILTISLDITQLSKKIDQEKEKSGINDQINPIIQKGNTSYFEDIIAKWNQLQSIVNLLLDSSKAISKKDQEGKGIRQILEKKQGLLRMKTMGKRVNHGGRTVITPDPLIGPDEIGVPIFLASKLYFPEKVTKFNIEYLKKLIIHGPFKYPGASQVIINNTNKIFSLSNVKNEYRNHIAELVQIGDIVNRHMENGDILLVNRQPTLHKPSIMAHKAKILPNIKTFRLHYTNCSSYNADFDGDEMNIHFPQDQISRSEGYEIAYAPNQYIVPTSGKPIRGLIQDSVDTSVYFTIKDSFFTRDEYYELLYCALERALNRKVIRKIVTIIPAIIKPKELYTGKQIITSIIASLTNSEYADEVGDSKIYFEHKTKIGKDIWGKANELEGNITIRDNELLTGVLDKGDIGSTDFGLIHSIYEIYGPLITNELLSALSRLFVNYFQTFHAFTCSVSDIIFSKETDFKRRVDIEKILIKGMISLGKFLDVEDFSLDLDNYSRRSVYSKHKDENNKIIQNMNLLPEEKKEINQIIKLQEMRIDKNLFIQYSQKEDDAKREQNNEEIEINRKLYNASYDKIKKLRDKFESIVLKDKSLEANCDTIVKNTLNEQTSKIPKTWIKEGLVVPFPTNNFTTMVTCGSKGSVVNQTFVTCMLGQQELEGKRVPRMSNGKTLPSFDAFDPNPRAGGYITDRFCNGIRPQEFYFHCMAGREGLVDTAVKTSRSGYLQRCLMKHLEQLIVGYDYTVRDGDGNIIQFYYGEDSIDVLNTKYLMNFKFIAENLDTYMEKLKPENIENIIDTVSVKNSIKNKEISINETLLNRFEPWKYLGSISEKLYEKMNDYLVNDPDHKFKVNSEKKLSRSKFKNVIFLKYLNSLINPGENVGVLAAQSVGEPSTQMTLNTFHLAGHGGANVTLGIPRMREILMTSEKNIKTPIMTLPILSKNEEDAKLLARKFENYKLIDIIKNIQIKQAIVFLNKKTVNNILHDKLRKYDIEIEIENAKDIKDYFDINKKELLCILKQQFIPTLAKSINHHIRIGNKNADISINKLLNEDTENNKKNNSGENYDEEEDNNNEEYEDDNAFSEKYESNKKKSYRKTNEEDEEKDNDNDEDDDYDEEGEEDEDESEQEKTYEDEDTNNENTVEDNDEDNTITNTNNYTTSSEDNTLTNNNTDNDSLSTDKKKKKKKINKDISILESNKFVYNNISIENINFVNNEINENKEKCSKLLFQLKIPFMVKNILLKNIIDAIVKKMNFKSVKGIKKCHLLNRMDNKNIKEYYLQLEGFNFKEVIKYTEDIDINRIGTNDIGGINDIYGIEACRTAIVKEIVNVFDVYSINVDKRHLGLIADYITFQGKNRNFSRKGISYSSSALLKMTYETTMEFLIEACKVKGYDRCNTDSARIILGKPPKCGTGAFDVLNY